MTNYEGPAVVVIDGEETAVAVVLAPGEGRGGLRSWHGVAVCDQYGLGWTAIESSRTVLRLPDGREADILPQRQVENGFTFIGSGAPPQ
jgi:hypothetical protein